MHSHKSEFALINLRRQLEEILAMVKAEDDRTFSRKRERKADFSVNHMDDVIDPMSALPLVADPLPCAAHKEVTCEPDHPGIVKPDDRDDLYNDALVLITEFGHASAAMLQMWLSIDQGRAITIFNCFQADGLISSTGKVRPRAFSLRRVLEQQA